MHVKEEKRGYAFGRERIRKTEREHKKRDCPSSYSCKYSTKKISQMRGQKKRLSIIIFVKNIPPKIQKISKMREQKKRLSIAIFL